MTENDHHISPAGTTNGDPRKKPSNKDAIDETLEKLRNSPKSREWFPKFALNLGEMAEQLDPSQPKNAAKRMFAKAFGTTADSAWRKRKRYLRYHGEETDFVSDGEYASSVEPYIRLAEAFAKLRFPSDNDAARKAHRFLVKGTSLDPRPSIDVSKIDGLTQALDCLKFTLNKCKADSNIMAALSYLNMFPIVPFGENELGRKLSTEDLSTRGRWFRDEDTGVRGEGIGIVAAPITTIAACRDLEDINRWYAGRVLLGYVYLPQIISAVKLDMSPDECIAAIEKKSEEAEEQDTDEARDVSKLEDEANDETEDSDDNNDPALDFVLNLTSDIISKYRIEDFDIGDEYFEEKPVPRLLQHTMYIRKCVYLILAYEDEQLQLKIDISGERNSFGYIDDEPEVFKRGDSPSKDQMVMPYTGAYVGIDIKEEPGVREAEDWAYRLVKCARWSSGEERIFVIGGPDRRNYYTRGYSSSLDDEDIKTAICEGSDPASSEFTPMVWDDLGELSAAPHGSIAAAILRNMAHAPEDQRIDAMLLKDAHARLRGIVSFVRENLQKTNAALSERGFEL